MRWQLKSADPVLVSEVQRSLNLSPLLARLLALRGVTSPEEAAAFLHPALTRLHSPYLLSGMAVAVERLETAIAQQERVLIYGDYDVDGTVAVVVLKTCIELLGGVTEFHVPHRIREGYGMKDDVIERAAAAGIRLVISVDTGIRAFQAAETARRLGLDLIVTDHHLPEDAGSRLPQALAVLNPNQCGCDYPCKDLCGAGVAFKVAQALLTRAGRERLIPSFLKMVAIATIADAVPLRGENRVIARLGLEGLRRPVNGGLKALLEVAKLTAADHQITATDVAFRIAPRINAAGRMDIAADVVELFTSRDPARQQEIADKLDKLNAERQAAEGRILDEVRQRFAGDYSLRQKHAVVLSGEGWHRGVVGIVATRVVEMTGRPALVIACEGSEAHGSGRSIPGFHLLQALESEDCRSLFIRFGGHAHAVGFSLASERIPELRRSLESYAQQHLMAEDLEPLLEIDAELRAEEITGRLIDEVDALQPFGMENREPVFACRGLRLLQPPRVLKEKHLKLKVGSPGRRSRPLDVLAWRMAAMIEQSPLQPGAELDLAFTAEENRHPDFGGLQLILRDLKPAQQANAANATAAASRDPE